MHRHTSLSVQDGHLAQGFARVFAQKFSEDLLWLQARAQLPQSFMAIDGVGKSLGCNNTNTCFNPRQDSPSCEVARLNSNPQFT